jgi:23S rRNA pseudouridine1911/1915/1917 synthase
VTSSKVLTGNRYVADVDAAQAGMRLDRFLAEALPKLSRTRIQALISDGRVERAGATVASTSQRVKSGDRFTIYEPPPQPAKPEGQDIALTVVYEDSDLIVIDKPAGLVVHPAPGNPDRTLVNALIAHCGTSLSGIGGEARPGIVHRLDKDTSGLMVAAKNDLAHQGLSQQFAEHSLDRAYNAVVWGALHPKSGTVTGRIGRNPHNRKKMAVVTHGGKFAETHYRVLRAIGDIASLVECRLATGRTHQIRVHMSSLGHSIVGDPVYGARGDARRLAQTDESFRAAAKALARQALHAVRIGFIHPRTKQQLSFDSSLPADIAALLDRPDLN